MIRFARPDYLYLLLLIPILVLFLWGTARIRTKALARFAELALIDRLAPSASSVAPRVKTLLLLLGVTLLVIGMANPQIGTRLAEVKHEGIDLFIALDVSLSMKAEDVRPNRLEKAKLEIRDLIDHLHGDRLGLIVFAGEAYTQFPLTTDYDAAYLFLDVMDTDVVPVPGTSIGSALRRALESFDFNEATTKAVVIVTDGENTEGDAFEVAEEAGKKGVLIYTVGMGSPSGSPIPIYDASGRQVDFKRDRSGNIVMSKLDEVSLQKIAELGHGTSYRDDLSEVYDAVNALQKREFGTKQFVDYEDRFQFFLGCAILMLLGEVLISEHKPRWIQRWIKPKTAEEPS
jgi:Ca-activated chloride channel family protein